MRERTDLLLSLLNHGIIEPYNYDTNSKSSPEQQQAQDEYCSLGLEACYGEGREISDALHCGGRAAVLLQQSRIKEHPQHYLKHDNDQALLLRTSYIEFTERAAVIAHQRGQNIARAVMKDNNDNVGKGKKETKKSQRSQQPRLLDSLRSGRR